MNIEPKGAQREVLALEPKGHTVVLGTAGSGKTTMALYLAEKLSNLKGNPRVLILTFNRAYNEEYKVTLKANTYKNNKRLAAQMIDEDGVPVARITVNIAANLSKNKPNINFVDTNNLPNIEQFLTENKIAKPTGNYAASGYCVYPEYEFDLTKFD